MSRLVPTRGPFQSMVDEIYRELNKLSRKLESGGKPSDTEGSQGDLRVTQNPGGPELMMRGRSGWIPVAQPTTEAVEGFTIPELTSNPDDPAVGDAWVLKTVAGGAGGGKPIGLLLALTYAGVGSSTTYKFSYQTSAGSKSVALT